MKRSLIIAVLFVSMSLIPSTIAVYQLVSNGNLGWPMVWGNELVVWGAIFSLLAVIGIVLAIAYRAKTPKGSIAVALLASFIVVYSLFRLVSHGIGPASKGDVDNLQLMEFWSSGWWK